MTAVAVGHFRADATAFTTLRRVEQATVELILYACPRGALADQIDGYMRSSAQRFGRNAAHAFPPHITLTGFFHDIAETVPHYVECCAEAIDNAPEAVSPRINVVGSLFRPDFHGLLIDSSWAQEMTEQFAARAAAVSETRIDEIRAKDCLHLSLAYDFAVADHDGLRMLTNEMVDPQADATWEVRLYERRPASQWKQHAAWVITDELEEHDQ